jgi:exopolysaccharide production protein ExoQ
MKRVEWLFHLLAFSLQCGAIVPLLLRTSVDANQLGAANPTNTIATGFVLLVVLAQMLRHGRPALRYAPGMWPVLSLVILALVSTGWSDHPDITIRRAGSLVTATLWAWYVTSRYDLKDVISIVRQSIGLLAVASLAIGILAPSMGRNDPSGLGPDGWPGVFATKNNLGTIMAFGVATYFYALITPRQKLFSYLFFSAGILLCVGMLYLSQSRTSWLIGLLSPVLCILIALTHKRVGAAIIIWTGVVLLLAPAVVIASDQLGTIALMLGRDSSLTGRVDLWLILPSYIEQRLWLGYGFAAFWVQDSANVIQIWSTVGWEPPHAHNGWLDLMLELGVAGLVLLAAQIVMIFTNGIRAVIDGREPDAQYVLLTTFLTIIYNLDESSLVRPDALWVMLVIAAATLARIGRQRRDAAAPRFVGRFQRRDFLASPPLR